MLTACSLNVHRMSLIVHCTITECSLKVTECSLNVHLEATDLQLAVVVYLHAHTNVFLLPHLSKDRRTKMLMTFSARSGNVQCTLRERLLHIQGTFSKHSANVQYGP
jgi:hypothetical protein